MKRLLVLLSLLLTTGGLLASSVRVVDHETLYEYELAGNKIRGVATPSLGSEEVEVWRTTWAPGCCTPAHSHDCEEIFIILKGQGKVKTASQELDFKAPCTLILPANVQHQLCNTGTEETECVVIMKTDSDIWNSQGDLMLLPWRL